jgi:hypothetical protein
VTNPIDAETLCFLDVVAYVRADTDASADCRDAVRDSYAGNDGKAVRDTICRMTDYVRLDALAYSTVLPIFPLSFCCLLTTFRGCLRQDCRNRIKYDTAENMAIVAIVALVS